MIILIGLKIGFACLILVTVFLINQSILQRVFVTKKRFDFSPFFNFFLQLQETVVKLLQSASRPKLLIFYHGTPKIENAYDILKYNRFTAKACNPPGLWTSNSFGKASVYAGKIGAVVELHAHIPERLFIDWGQVKADGRYQRWVRINGDSPGSVSMFIIRILKKRVVLFREGVFIFVAPVDDGKTFFRIDGVRPARIFDPNGNAIN
jgi:hypothetical protein